MTSKSSKIVAALLVLLVLAAGGVIGYVVGQRSVANAASEGAPLKAKMERFVRVLKLTPEQREQVSEILAATRTSVREAQQSGQETILTLLNEEQKVRYLEMLERQKERRARRAERRGKRGKKGKKRKKRRNRGPGGE